MNSSGQNRAVIIGGGIVGLLAARVLSDYFHCTLIEADKPPESPEPRKGAPQTTQPHILLAQGYRIIEELFPAIGSDWVAKGTLPIDWVKEFYRYNRLTGWNVTGSDSSEILSVTCTRPLLEWCIRERVYNLKNVHCLEGCQVVGLLGNVNQSQITGVRVQQDDAFKELSADLVVDAGGRFSQAPKWLKAQGFEAPKETVVEPYLGYATRRYRPPQGYKDYWKVILVSQSPPDNKRLGYLAQVENGEWIATVGGFGGDYPPTNEQGFLKFAKSLSDPKFYEAIKAATPQSSVYAYRATANRLRHYENTQLPNGFISIGDAVCALCPVYGQGITQAAQSVLVLRSWIEDSQRRLFKSALDPSRFHKKLAKSNASFWSMATGMDLRFPSTKQFPPGEAKPKKELSQLSKLIGRYTASLQHGTSVDPELNLLFMKVIHQVSCPFILFHPAVILRVLRTTKKSKICI